MCYFLLERLERIVGYGKGLGRDSALDGAACYVAGLLAIVCLHLQSSESINPRCYALVSLLACQQHLLTCRPSLVILVTPAKC